jgi:hypothetical protein
VGKVLPPFRARLISNQFIMVLKRRDDDAFSCVLALGGGVKTRYRKELFKVSEEEFRVRNR